jgi:hypothetical protein
VFRGQRRATSSRQVRRLRTLFVTALSLVALSGTVIGVGTTPATARNAPRHERIPGGYSHPASSAGEQTTCQPTESNCPKTSRLWSGYVVQASGPTYTTVSASWVQPKVTCPKKSSPDPPWTLFWVGLDGWSTTKTVEQGGSEGQCQGGTVHYYAWWEMYPTNAIQSTFPIAAGDHISSSVAYSSTDDTYTVTIDDNTPGHLHSLVVVASTNAAADDPDTYTTTQDGVSSGPTAFPTSDDTTPGSTPGELCAPTDPCGNSSAEWIVEAPGDADNNPGDMYPLARFHPIVFTSADATDTAGHQGSISDSVWQYTGLNLINGSSQLLAHVRPLKSEGQRFRDVFDRS